MTIAACHVSPEGVVLGADSTTTMLSASDQGTCHLDHAQKVFEVGPPGSSAGLVWWGLGQIGSTSHRTIAAEIGARHKAKAFGSLQDLAQAIADAMWTRFTKAFPADVQRAQDLLKKAVAKAATQAEIEELSALVEAGSGGYCVAGRIEEFGDCRAYEIHWGPHLSKPTLTEVPHETPRFWGIPWCMERIVYGVDSSVADLLLQSGKWAGTADELLNLVQSNPVIVPRNLPIREAVDWVHTIIHATIRIIKFAQWPHYCGGPVEIAVVTTDRHFRWVRHKKMDAAILTEEEMA